MSIFDDIPEPGAAPSSAPKRGRPRGSRNLPKVNEAEATPSTAFDILPTTFEQSLQLLSDEERGFVRSYIADPTKGASRAYAAAFPSSRNARTRGPAMLDRERVSISIKLGREDVARSVAEACRWDKQASFEELGRLAEKAEACGQYTAAVRASELRARLTGVLVDKQEIKSTNFSLVFENMPTPAQVIDVQATPSPTPEEHGR